MPKQTASSENAIRDHLAKNLDLIEPGLTLVKKEKLLRNDKGARGFIDLFARTASGQFLIIEIKRSDAAARQAIQEITKYTALLKQNLLVKDTEIRMLVLSTEWHELLVPFSEFVRATRYECGGRQIIVGDDGLTERVTPITLAPPELARKFSCRHFIWHFTDDTTARAAIPRLSAHMANAGLDDFIIALVGIKNIEDDNKRFLYFAQQEKMFDEYLQLIRARFSEEEVKDFEDYVSDFTELEDRISEAADKAWDKTEDGPSLYKQLGAASCEISHPEKARAWFDSDLLICCEIFRYGRFDGAEISDETLVAELVGLGGASDYRVDISARLESRPEVDAFLVATRNIFFFNPEWKAAVENLLAYGHKTDAVSIELRAFNNDDILRTLAGLCIGYPSYAPGFRLSLVGDDTECFAGVIEWNGRVPDLAYLIAEYFDNDQFQYFLARHLNVNRGMNADLMSEVGLTYNVARETQSGPVKIRVHGASIEDARGPKNPSIFEFLEQNTDFLTALVSMFEKHEMEFAQLICAIDTKHLEIAEDLLAEQVLVATPSPKFWLGDLENCDLCERPFATARFMIDGATTRGPWACMCASCFQALGDSIGPGHGQLYKKTDDGWQLVAGQLD